MKKKTKPPFFANLLANIIFPKNDNFYLRGDFKEIYFHILETEGRFSAWCWYWWQILISIPHFISDSFFWRLNMFKNYVKIALRNLKKHKGFSFINITGLAIGMACCILIFSFFQEELSYDNFHKDLDRLYRVVMHFESEGFTRDFAKVGPSVGQKLRDDYPGVETVARMMKFYRPLIQWENNKFYEGRCYYSEPKIFDILTFNFLQGDSKTALSRPKTAVISENMIYKYFGAENPIGKFLTIDSENFEITGIIENYPSNTHLKCDFLLSFKTIENEDMATEWGWTNFQTYLKLSPNVDVENFREQISQIENHYRENYPLNRYYLQNIKDIHLHSHMASETEPPGNPLIIYITITIGLLILLIACINYFNLTTARFSNRAKEVGMRKVVGAKRQQLIFQFLGESLITTFFAFLLALVIAGFALPLLNQMTNNFFTFQDFATAEVLFISILLIIFVGIIAGSYPSLVLSLFRPSSVLKSKISVGTKGTVLRKVLVLGQFAVTIFFIIGTLIIYKQLHFMQTTDLGFAKEQKLILPFEGDYLKDQQFEAVKTEFLSNPQINGATVSSGVPGIGVGAWGTSLIGVQDSKSQTMSYLFLDFDFIKEYEMKVVAGRNFNRDMVSDLNEAFIINETAAKAFGFTSSEEALNKQIAGNPGQGTIIGVVKDFHYDGLQRKIEPLVFMFGPDKGLNRFNKTGTITLNLTTDNLQATLAAVKEKWQQFNQTIPFSFYFFDDIFDRFYRDEIQTRQIISLFTFLGLFVSCLGLFGLATFIAEQRTKEIGIRKVLGASVSKIIIMISREFVMWILCANILAWPIAYFFMNKWLQNFAYKISLGLPIFLLAGLIVLFIALVTVSYQSVRAATANPVKSLKYE